MERLDSIERKTKTVIDLVSFVDRQFAGTVSTLTPESIFEPDRQIKNISQDSRKIEKDDLFIALQGEKFHGLDFIEDVLSRQPAAIISDKPLVSETNKLIAKVSEPPLIVVIEQVAEHLGDLASWFYNRPSQTIKVVGITGTNGKTSSAFFTAQLLESFNQKVALIGTLGNGPLNNLQATENTTPSAIDVQRLLSDFLQQGYEWVVMEVSSHALTLGRIQAVEFCTVALTQVTRDHIDFHGSEESYRESKAKLFTDYKTKNRVINLADQLGRQIYDEREGESQYWGYSSANSDQAELKILASELTLDGIEAKVENNTETANLSLPLMGAFNTENVLCAMSILLVNGFAWNRVCIACKQLLPVSGRMQILHKLRQADPTVIIDFAHTPDALLQVLQAIRGHLNSTTGKLIVVFGCGGNRDQGKRPIMAGIAEKLADKVVITSDNPRFENPMTIIDEIKQGLLNPSQVITEVDRTAAISETLNNSNSEDVILIAGKGHEDYQEIKGVKQPYSDIGVVNEWFSRND